MDRPRSRRATIGVLGVAVASGCLSIGVGPDGPRLSEISVQNKHDEPHTFTVQALSAESVRAEWSYDAPAATYRNGRLQKTTGRVWNRPLESTTDVTIRARIDDEGWGSYALAEYPGDCLRIEVEVETDAHLQIELAACD